MTTGTVAPMAPAWVVRLVMGLSDQAVAWVTEAIYREYATLLSPLGTRGRMQTRQDIFYHLEFLAGSLSTGQADFFQDYVRWAAEVLRSRGVPVGTLSSSLSYLERFFADRLDPAARQPVAKLLAMGLDALQEQPGEGGSDFASRILPAALPQAGDLTRHLLEGDIGATRALVRQAQAEGAGYLQIATGLFQPALYSVGRMWQRNEITVAQEHLATAMAQTLLTQVFVRSEFAQPTRRKALFACVAGNFHGLGLRIVCDGFELRGWSVQFLGANVPSDALVLQVDQWRPEQVCLSASLVQQLPELRRVISEIRSEMGANRPSIVVGGLATNQVDKIWSWVGADEWSPDAQTALTTGG